MNPYWIVVAVAVYYSCAWLLVGRKRAGRSISVRYAPPRGLTPAALRYVYTMSCDGRSYAAIIAQLAAKNLLAVTVAQKGVVTLRRQVEDDRAHRSLPGEEARVFKDLFERNVQVELKRPELSTIERIQRALEAPPTTSYFTRNFIWAALGLGLTAVATIWVGLSSGVFGSEQVDAWIGAGFAGLTVAMYGLAGYWIWDTNCLAFSLALRGLYQRRTLPLLLFFIVLYPALWYVLIRTVAPQFAILTTLLILVNGFAAPSLRNYTAAGRALRDEIEGFRQFLLGTEQDRLQRMNVPGEVVQFDPAMIAYAIALDLREAWGDHLGIKSMVETAL